MSPILTNTVAGTVSKVASGAITQGCLVKMTTSGLVTAAAAVTDRVMFVALETVTDGQPVLCQPLSPDRQVRVKLGTITTVIAGTKLYVGATPAADGRATDESGGGALAIGYAEEVGVAGQLCLIRPISAV